MSYLSDLGDDSANGTKTVYTKFDLKDEVWLVARNVVVNTMVTKVEIHLDEENQEVKYSTLNEHDIPENRVFKTKDELFESLKLPVKQDKDVNHDGKDEKGSCSQAWHRGLGGCPMTGRYTLKSPIFIIASSSVVSQSSVVTSQ